MAGRGKKDQCWYFTNSLLRHITRPSRTSLFNSRLWSSCSLGSETNVPIFLCQIFKSMQYYSIHSHSTSSQSFLCIFWCICILVFSLALPHSHWFEIKPCSPFACKAPAIHPGEGRPSEHWNPAEEASFSVTAEPNKGCCELKGPWKRSTPIPLFSAVSKYKALLVWLLKKKKMSWIWKWTSTLLLWKANCFPNHH